MACLWRWQCNLDSHSSTPHPLSSLFPAVFPPESPVARFQFQPRSYLNLPPRFPTTVNDTMLNICRAARLLPRIGTLVPLPLKTFPRLIPTSLPAKTPLRPTPTPFVPLRPLQPFPKSYSVGAAPIQSKKNRFRVIPRHHQPTSTPQT